MKRIALLCALLFSGNSARSCVSCSKQVQDAIFDSTFYPNLFVMLSAFFVLAAIILTFSWLSTRRFKGRLAASPGTKELASVPLMSAAAVLGIGMGGFTDGIVLHQILQWHEMLTARIPADSVTAKSVNMFWDGIFHAFTLLTSLLGVYLLWKLLQKENINRSGYLLSGGMLGGWGLFNLVEGIIDHHILVLHNVRELSSYQDAWNYGFLAFGVLLLLVGWMLLRRGIAAARIA